MKKTLKFLFVLTLGLSLFSCKRKTEKDITTNKTTSKTTTKTTKKDDTTKNNTTSSDPSNDKYGSANYALYAIKPVIVITL